MQSDQSLALKEFVSHENFSIRARDSHEFEHPAVTVHFTPQEIGAIFSTMRNHSWFFGHRYNLDVSYCRDLGGCGRQMIRVTEDNKGEGAWRVSLFFQPNYSAKEEFCYEAELITDQRKDYEPSINRGIHQFRLERFTLSLTDVAQIEHWFKYVFPVLRHETERLKMEHETLEQWVGARLDMAVKCSKFMCRKDPILIPHQKLQTFIDLGYSLEDLQDKLVCSVCGKSRPTLLPF